jgi:ATP-dependent DNA ligase
MADNAVGRPTRKFDFRDQLSHIDAIPDTDGPWQYEPKWDGFRCLAFKMGAAVELRAKSGKPLGRIFRKLSRSSALQRRQDL